MDKKLLIIIIAIVLGIFLVYFLFFRKNINVTSMLNRNDARGIVNNLNNNQNIPNPPPNYYGSTPINLYPKPPTNNMQQYPYPNVQGPYPNMQPPAQPPLLPTYNAPSTYNQSPAPTALPQTSIPQTPPNGQPSTQYHAPSRPSPSQELQQQYQPPPPPQPQQQTQQSLDFLDSI